MKKIYSFSVLLVLLFMFVGFASCSSDNDEDKDSSGSNSANLSVNNEVLKIQEITTNYDYSENQFQFLIKAEGEKKFQVKWTKSASLKEGDDIAFQSGSDIRYADSYNGVWMIYPTSTGSLVVSNINTKNHLITFEAKNLVLRNYEKEETKTLKGTMTLDYKDYPIASN